MGWGVAGEMVLRLRALAISKGDLGSFPSTHTAAAAVCNQQFQDQGIQRLLLASLDITHSGGISRQYTEHEVVRKKFLCYPSFVLSFTPSFIPLFLPSFSSSFLPPIFDFCSSSPLPPPGNSGNTNTKKEL